MTKLFRKEITMRVILTVFPLCEKIHMHLNKHEAELTLCCLYFRWCPMTYRFTLG